MLATISSPSLASQIVDAPLLELTEGPFWVLASCMDAHDLCQMDITCIELRTRSSTLGLWRALGARVYHGIELERVGIFGSSLSPVDLHYLSLTSLPKSIHSEQSWKVLYGQFKRGILEFRSPYGGTEITQVKTSDEVVYCRCKLRTDLQNELMKMELTGEASYAQASEAEATAVAPHAQSSEVEPAAEAPRAQSSEAEDRCGGVYLEMEVIANADNLSLVVVDFDSGERSSVTFSPDTGAVIKETKTQEAPHTVQGAYIQPLQSKIGRFVGQMGLFMHKGNIAFFRKYTKQDSDETEPEWETTGFIIDVHWAEGRKLTPCIAFRDEGSYHVRVSRVGSSPPVWPKTLPGAYRQQNWITLNWEAM
eukprot:gnl/MRDRNA2_/MRDRNA2_116334_c0_seq1.p1 gnl/MRDRNA2_/MRDRNA2_116334_c0~~gnl/MRDRNA2_/MRDRNA2_116334_c0_seq1.p1  ORF type:complete len:385 (-),score=51.08 gnl/MRDRNA2_/MRDRNA2_116334_c0_seq1:18-1112(-)